MIVFCCRSAVLVFRLLLDSQLLRCSCVPLFSGIASPSGASTRLYSRLSIAWLLCPPSSPTARPRRLGVSNGIMSPLQIRCRLKQEYTQQHRIFGTFKATQILSTTSSITAFDASFFECLVMVAVTVLWSSEDWLCSFDVQPVSVTTDRMQSSLLPLEFTI